MNTKSKRFKLLTLTMAIAGALSPTVAFGEEESEAIEVIQVSGIRSSLGESIQIKRTATSIQDSIVAEDIGKFPDQNVAESLQRIPGVMIDRNNGEGSKVTVRGMGPKFNTVKVNNRTIATTERGREFDFQALPSELISGADVVKTSRANIAEGSLGAYVNVNTARPLKHKGFQAVGSVNMLYNDMSEENDFAFSGVVSNTFLDDTFGVLVGLSQKSTTNRIDAASTTHWESFEIDGSDGIVDKILSPVDNIYRVQNTRGEEVTDGLVWTPGRAAYSLDIEERERTSANVTFQWQQDEDTLHTFDVLYSDLSRQAQSSGMQVPLQHAGWRDLVVSDNFTMLEGKKYKRPIDGLMQERGQDSDTLALGLNSIFYRDKWTFETDVSYSKANASPRGNSLVPHFVNPNHDITLDPTDPNYVDGQIKGLTDSDVIDLDNHGDILAFTSTIETGNPAAVRTHWNDIRHSELEDEVLEAKFDAKYAIDEGILSSFDVGIAYTDREKSSDVYKIANGCQNVDSWNQLLTDEEAAGIDAETLIAGTNLNYFENTIRPFNTCNMRVDMNDDIFSVNNSNFLSQESGNIPRDFVLLNNFDAYKAEIARIRSEDDWTVESLSAGESVANTERNLALYSQFNLEGEAKYFMWSGNVGIRYVQTKTSSTGASQEIDELTRVPGDLEGESYGITYHDPQVISKSTSYSHLLPSLNLSFDFENGYMIRTAAAKVITRPAIEAVGVNKSYPVNARAGSYNVIGGNPDLTTFEATQYDLAFEYYQDNGNAYSLGFFYKDITNFISNSKTSTLTPVANFGDVGVDKAFLEGTFESKNNRPGGTVSGAEVSALHFFDYLPGWLSGFGVQANYTYTDSKDANAANDVGNDASFLENVVPSSGGLEGYSKNAYNVIAFYDKDDFQVRIAYNWRDSFLKYRSGPTVGSTGLPQHVDAYGQLDLSISYDINKQFTVSAEVINATDANVLEYADIRERVILKQYTGRRFQIGVRAKF